MLRQAPVIIVTVLLVATPCLAGSIVLNGSFECSPINPGVFTTLSQGNTNPTNWTIDSGSIDYIGSYWQPSDGSRSLDMSGNGPGKISQDLTTVIGQEYEVVFWMAGNPDGGNPSKTLVGVAGISQTFTQEAKSKTDMGWTRKSFLFTATSTTTTLSFESQDNNAYGPALDDVSVTAVPLPAAAWLGLAMLGGVGAVRTIRRRRSSR